MSISCIAQRNHLIGLHIVPVFQLKTGSQGPINIIIRLHLKIYLIIT